MMKNEGNILLSWLKSFFVHGNTEPPPPDFDISDKTAEPATQRSQREKRWQEKSERIEKRNAEPFTGTSAYSSTSSGAESLVLDEVNILDEYLLHLFRESMADIREFEKELDKSMERLNDEFNKITQI
ncbi:hypothetical protein [Dysgonomonas sp. 511]|uniref:hypothetical protein n=1 Tax=Dysgonomonas sp. 511 TaxID=2302930 RepID=UPI0013D024A7|nr:hypothetical protein [Dysgonomonas sp. 511]